MLYYMNEEAFIKTCSCTSVCAITLSDAHLCLAISQQIITAIKQKMLCNGPLPKTRERESRRGGREGGREGERGARGGYEREGEIERLRERAKEA